MPEELHLDLSCYGEDPKQKLPTEADWKDFLKVLNHYIYDMTDYNKAPTHYAQGKLILLNKVAWHNAITKEKQAVYNMPLMTRKDTGSRPWAIVSITYEKWDARNGRWVSDTNQRWTFADKYYHINISNSCSEMNISNDYNCDKRCYMSRYKVRAQEVCTPILSNSFYKEDLFPTRLCSMYKAQLQGQNTGSAYQTVSSILNAWTENAIRDNNSQLIPAQAPHLQLLTRKSLDYLRNNIGSARALLQSLNLPANDSQVLVKYKKDQNYVLATKDVIESQSSMLSQYYTPITYEDIQHITENLPKQEVDLICCGVGSAGSGILDQLSRSTYIKSYLLVDPDRVERKNLRNQWYNTSQARNNNTKVDSSRYNIQNMCPSNQLPSIIQKACLFQEAHLDQFICKYLVSGFDSIPARLELLEMVEKGLLETQYLIDTRYDDLTASIFFVDVNDEGQMRRYRKGLEADYEAFKIRDEEHKKQTSIQTLEQFMDWVKKNDAFEYNCLECQLKIGNVAQEDIDEQTRNCECHLITDVLNMPCGGEACKARWAQMYEQFKENIAANIKRVDVEEQESSCVRQNFIDIYKYASTFVFAAIREIENGEAKPFTHVEAQTEKFPTHMIVGK